MRKKIVLRIMRITKSLITLSAVFIIICFSSCGHKALEIGTIAPDFNNVMMINVSEDDIISLETSAKSLLYDICGMYIEGGNFYIQSRNHLRVFDSQGKYVKDISSRGHGEGEYQRISNFFVKEGNVFIYDFDSQSLFRYGLDGSFVSRIRLSNIDLNEMTPPSALFPCGKGWVSVNCYGGDRSIPTLSMWDEDLQVSKSVKGRFLKSGTSFYDKVFVSEDSCILYWEPLCDTVFEIRDDTLYPLYKIDFGEKALPKNIAVKTIDERLSHLASHPEITFYGMARWYQRCNGNLYFSFMGPEKRVFLCRYNETNGDTRVFRITTSLGKYRVQPFFHIDNDRLLVEAHDEDEVSVNPSLLIIRLEDLENGFTGDPNHYCVSWMVDLFDLCTFIGGANSVGGYEI